MINIDNVVEHYAICALWSTPDDTGEPLDDNYDIDDIDGDTFRIIVEQFHMCDVGKLVLTTKG